MKEIKLGGLGGGFVALVDDQFFDYLSQFNWSAVKSRHGGRVYTYRREMVDGKRKQLWMHRVVAGLAGMDIAGRDVDHRNLNTLDNTVGNLRAATRSANLCNRGKMRSNQTGAKGVSWDKRSERFRADITVNGRQITLGRFSNREDAADAYAVAAVKYHGEFARDESGSLSEADVSGAERRLHELQHRPHTRNTSGYRGIRRTKHSNRWEARIKDGSRTTHIGTFATREAAALAFDSEATRLHGDKARLNFPFLQ